MPESSATESQYNAVIEKCRNLFAAKTKDYGTAWRVLRTISVRDQIYIKALRIRTIQEKKIQKIDDAIDSEFIGIINYAIIGVIQLHLPEEAPEELTVEEALSFYNTQAEAARRLMQDKNHDYGEAWRNMSLESLVDLILMKLLRIRQIVTNEGKTAVSEGIDANFFDIINYAVFALILMHENELRIA